MKIGILGYGNLGRGVESAVRQNEDMELTCIITRRDPKTVKPATEGVEVYSVNDIDKLKDKIDVLVLCGGSASVLARIIYTVVALAGVWCISLIFRPDEETQRT